MIDMNTTVLIAVGAGVIGLVFSLYQRNYVMAQDEGSDRMKQIAAAIQSGAQAFLSREYRAVAILVVIVTVALVFIERSAGVRDVGVDGRGLCAGRPGVRACRLYRDVHRRARQCAHRASRVSELEQRSTGRFCQRYGHEHDGGITCAAWHQHLVHSLCQRIG